MNHSKKIFIYFIFGVLLGIIGTSIIIKNINSNILKTARKKYMFGAPIDSDTVKKFIRLYRDNPIPQFIYSQTDTLKAFYLDEKIIKKIQEDGDINGLFLYLARREEDLQYTFIAVPSLKRVSGGQVGHYLLTSKMYEWHDLVIKNVHKPANEIELGYLPTE
jgi:hypothetical protein